MGHRGHRSRLCLPCRPSSEARPQPRTSPAAQGSSPHPAVLRAGLPANLRPVLGRPWPVLELTPKPGPFSSGLATSLGARDSEEYWALCPTGVPSPCLPHSRTVRVFKDAKNVSF